MIRYFSMKSKLNQLIKSDIDIFFMVINAYFLSVLVCPLCGAKGCCSSHMSYSRWVITVEDGGREAYEVDIPCVLCDSCGHSHAVLPDILIPYSSYSLRFILHVLEGYLKRTCTVVDFCSQWEIAVSTLYYWKHLFLDHASLLAGVLNRFETLVTAALDYIRDIESLPSLFFEQFKFSFLQQRYKKATEYQNSS